MCGAGAIDVSSGDAFLFMPRLPDSFGVWFGELPTPTSVRAKYGVQVSCCLSACHASFSLPRKIARARGRGAAHSFSSALICSQAKSWAIRGSMLEVDYSQLAIHVYATIAGYTTYGYSSYSNKLTAPRTCLQYVHYVGESPAVLADVWL